MDVSKKLNKINRLKRFGFPPIFIKPVDKDDYMSRFESEEREAGRMLDFMCDRLPERLKVKQQ